MQEDIEVQQIPVKMYRSDDRLMVAAPMPGLEPGDISVEVTADGYLVLHGELRGTLKGMKDLLLDEWSIGDYHRVLQLPENVNGEMANVTYGNGVLVVALPIQSQTVAATLRLDEMTPTHGTRAGNAGHPSDGYVAESNPTA